MAVSPEPEPLPVKARKASQGGYEIWVGQCPKCRTEAALNAVEVSGRPAKHLCRGCHSLLSYSEAK